MVYNTVLVIIFTCSKNNLVISLTLSFSLAKVFTLTLVHSLFFRIFFSLSHTFYLLSIYYISQSSRIQSHTNLQFEKAMNARTYILELI